MNHLSDPYTIATIAIGLFLVILMLVSLVKSRRSRVLIKDRMDTPRLCDHCGYNLTNLVVPRCPDCGKAIGFDKSFEELGIDEAEVIRHAERRHKELDQMQMEETWEGEETAEKER